MAIDLSESEEFEPRLPTDWFMFCTNGHLTSRKILRNRSVGAKCERRCREFHCESCNGHPNFQTEYYRR